jgi:hypothetical protein
VAVHDVVCDTFAEQAEGRLDLLGPASDVYSLGATLYHLLTGQVPFTDEDTETILRKVRQGEFPPPRAVNRAVPGALDAVCRKAMALKSADRYPSASALAREVECWLADEPVAAWREPWGVRARRWVKRHRTLVSGTAAGLGAAVVILACAAWLLSAAYGRARRGEAEAREAQAAAEEQRRTAEHSSYSRSILLAQREWKDNRLDRAFEVLQDCPADLRRWEWRYLNRLAQPDALSLYGHTGRIVAVAVSADGGTAGPARGVAGDPGGAGPMAGGGHPRGLARRRLLHSLRRNPYLLNTRISARNSSLRYQLPSFVRFIFFCSIQSMRSRIQLIAERTLMSIYLPCAVGGFGSASAQSPIKSSPKRKGIS